MPIDELTSHAMPYLREKFGETLLNDIEFVKKIVELHRTRIKTLAELPEMASYFFVVPNYNVELLYWQNINKEQLLANLDFIYNLLLNLDERLFTRQQLETLIMPEAEKRGRGGMLWPLRVALSGQKNSAGPFEIMEIIGKNESLNRLIIAIKKLQDNTNN